ncbi:MAG: hypothetical protein N2595_04090 [bacterium]|nr:hypothetical protein [bacterium]
MAARLFSPETTLDELLLVKRRITEEQLAEVRRVQAIEGGGWASHFVDAGCISENELLQLVISETGLPYLPVLRVTLKPDLVREFTTEFLTTFECLPIDEIPPVLTLATPNPFQVELLRSRKSAVREVQLFVCRVSEWRECMRRITQERGVT